MWIHIASLCKEDSYVNPARVKSGDGRKDLRVVYPLIDMKKAPFL
jgi:hypothetical protein